jgi:hypothetical protein
MNNVYRYQLALEKFWHTSAEYNTGVSVNRTVMTFWEKMTHPVLLRLNLTSPIIFTGTQTILKVMKSVGIPYYDCSPN